MNIHSIFPSESKSMVTLGDALDNLEYDNEEVQTLTEKFSRTAYWKDTGSKMPDNPDKVLTGMDYHHKGHHFNLKRVSLNAMYCYLLLLQWVVMIQLLVHFIGMNLENLQ